MPIPTQIDHRLAEIDDLAAGVLICLRTMRHSPVEPDQLRMRLQAFVDAVTGTANEIINGVDPR
jgi:hypothetical protein